MKRIVRALIVTTLCLSGAQCATTTDPRGGGLFSYDPQAYQQRLDDRQAKLKELETQKEEEKRRQKELEEKLSSQKALHDETSEKMRSLERSLAQLDEVLGNTKTKSKEDEKNLVQTSIKLKALKEEVAKLRAEKKSGSEAQKKEIKRLNEIVEQLLKEAEALSKM